MKDISLQGGIIMGNLGTWFPHNLMVSQGIFIVNPAYLSQKCDTPKMTQLYQKTILSYEKIVLATGKILLVHKGWILITRWWANLLTGSTPCVTGRYNYFVSHKKYFLWLQQNGKSFLWLKIFFLCRTLLVWGIFPVTWWSIPMSQEKLLVTGRIPPVAKGV